MTIPCEFERFTVSVILVADAAAPCFLAASSVREICSWLMNGRAPSCTAMNEAFGDTAAMPFETESCLFAPPAVSFSLSAVRAIFL